MERTEIDTYIPLIDYLKRARGLDLSGYKSAGLIRRINKRMSMVGIESLPDYIDYLEVHPEEFNLFFDTILINVTGFFRDPAAWEYLAKEIIPKILANRRKDEAFRAWSTGCATGEEAYSIAMLLSEAMGEDAYRDQVKIYATDIDDGALAKARSATYTEKDVQDIPPELREKYLVRSGSAYTLNKELRRSVIFGRNNLVNDAPISRVDLLVCRNTLMYFTAEMQSKILARFNFSLRDYGYLFLGKAEMLLTHSHLFIPADLKLRIFSKVPQFRNREHQAVTANLVGDKDSESINGAGRLRDAALESSPVAQVILNQNNQLVNANEKARNLLGIKTSDLGRPFQDLDFSFKPVELRSSLQAAYKQRTTVILHDLTWQVDERIVYYEVRIHPLGDYAHNPLGASITWINTSQHKELQNRLEQTNHELETAFEELQSTNEELETTNEELQSTIEELETTNEELHSTNEELETMNEELQSTNEELHATNEELHHRTENLAHLNIIMNSVMSSMQTGLIVVNKDLTIQTWNWRSEDFWGLREDEVVGQNLLGLDIGLPIDQLKKVVLDCLNKDCGSQETTIPARNRRGRDFLCKVGVTPLVKDGKEVLGAVLTLDEALPVEGKNLPS